MQRMMTRGTWQTLMANCASRVEQTLRKGRVTLSAASTGTAAATGLSSGMETGSLILGRGAPTAKSTSMPKGTPPGHARHTFAVTHRFAVIDLITFGAPISGLRASPVLSPVLSSTKQGATCMALLFVIGYVNGPLPDTGLCGWRHHY